jgi:hypothetical protein
MKLHFNYAFESVVPDELDFLLDIVYQVCDYFFHEDINFYVTNDINLNFSTQNNIVFLSGCEQNSKLKNDNFKLCFNNFYRNYGDQRYVPFPLGNNKFINKNLYKHELISFPERQYDVFFAGFIHESRINFKNALNKLNSKKYIHYTDRNNLQEFSKNLDPEKYLEFLKNSKILLAPSGAYHSTSYRYFESLYFQNIVIFQKNKNEEFFLEGNFSNHYCINNWSDLSDSLITNLINNYDQENSKQEYKKNFSKHSIISFAINKILNYDN